MLKRTIQEYIDLRRATGFKFVDSARLLRQFAEFAFERGDDVVRSATAIAWAGDAGTPRQRHRRLGAVVRFAQFARAEDERHEIPPANTFATPAHRLVPHIFSDEEISKIVACAGDLGPTGSLRPFVYSTLFGLMAVAGLRRAEALELRIGDLVDDGLIIRESKFRKSRFVPLHETTIAVLERYVKARKKVACHTDHLFVSIRKGKLSPEAVLYTFHEVCARASIGSSKAGKRPRPHDLRHTFAVRALEACPAGRDAVNRHMLALTTYMGHAKVESTYWYLETTPQLLRDIAMASEAFVTRGV